MPSNTETTNSHVYIAKSILRRFCTKESGKNSEITFYDFEKNKIRRKGAGAFNKEKNYFSKTNEDNLSIHCETPTGKTIRNIQEAYRKNKLKVDINDRDFATIINYVTYQLIRDKSVYRICEQAGALPKGMDEKAFKNALVNHESKHPYFSEIFNDAGIQFVFNETDLPFLLTSGVAIINANSKKHYIMQITLTPLIAVLITNNAALKATLRSNSNYGIINSVDEDWVSFYNQVIFSKASTHPPHILVSYGEKSIKNALSNIYNTLLPHHHKQHSFISKD